MSVPSDSPLVDATRIVQLRAVLWSMRSAINTAKREASIARSLLFELQALADAGVALADCVIDEAS